MLTFKRVLVYIIFEKLGCMQRGPDLVESSGLASLDQDLVLHQIKNILHNNIFINIVTYGTTCFCGFGSR